MKYYAVRKGRMPGIYTSWDECKAMVDKFAGAEYKSFPDKSAAMRYLTGDEDTPKASVLPRGLCFDGGTGLSAFSDTPVAESNVTDEKGTPVITNALLSSLPLEDLAGAYHERESLRTVLFEQSEGFTNNFAELYALFLALTIAESDPSIDTIMGDSELIIRWWSTGHVNISDERTLHFVHRVITLRRDFEARGGRIRKISGDDNPADLGFHK